MVVNMLFWCLIAQVVVSLQVRENGSDEMEKLCIFGSLRSRRGAELKVTLLTSTLYLSFIVPSFPTKILKKNCCVFFSLY